MPRPVSPGWRRFRRSLLYAAAGAVLLCAAYLLLAPGLLAPGAKDRSRPRVAGQASAPVAELARFSSMVENRPAGDRLHVTFHVRLRDGAPREGFVFLVAGGGEDRPEAWAVWPPQGEIPPVSPGGHLRVEDPKSGHRVQLTAVWAQVKATLDLPAGQPAVEKVVVYVLSPGGKTILARPYAL